MIRKPKNQPRKAELRNTEDGDFAEEAGPKETEFKKEKDVKAVTAKGFERIP